MYMHVCKNPWVKRPYGSVWVLGVCAQVQSLSIPLGATGVYSKHGDDDALGAQGSGDSLFRDNFQDAQIVFMGLLGILPVPD